MTLIELARRACATCPSPHCETSISIGVDIRGRQSCGTSSGVAGSTVRGHRPGRIKREPVAGGIGARIGPQQTRAGGRIMREPRAARRKAAQYIIAASIGEKSASVIHHLSRAARNRSRSPRGPVKPGAADER